MGHLVGWRRLGIAEATVSWRFWYVLGISVDLEPVWFSREDLFSSKVLERGRASVQCLWQRCLLYLFIFLETLGNTCHRGHGILERGLVQPRCPICDFTVAKIQKWRPGRPAWLGGIDLEGTFGSYDSLPEQLILGCQDLPLSAVFILIVGNGPVLDLVLRVQGRRKIHRRSISGMWIRRRWIRWRPSDGRTGTCGLSSVVQSSGPSHRCPGPSHWHAGSSVWCLRWSLGPPGWGVIISGRRNGWLCSGPGLGIRNSHTRVHPTLHQSPHGHEINQSSLVGRSWQWQEQKTADIRQHGWVLFCSWRVPCWSTMGHRTIHNCWAVHCRVLMVCWAGLTCRVVIIKCWAVSCWLLTCWVSNFLWLIHDVRLVWHPWPWRVPLLTRHLLTRDMLGRHLLGRHLPGRHLPGRPQPLSDPSLLLGHPFQLQIIHCVLAGPAKESPWWFFSLVTGQWLGTAVPPVWRRRMNQTSQHFQVFRLDDDQADTCYLLTPSMMMKTGTYDHPMTCDDGDGNERKTLKAGHPSPLKWHGSTPDHPSNQPASWSWTHPIDDVGRARSLSTSTLVSRRMMGPWGVLVSVGSVRSSIALPTSWSVAFRLIDTLEATDFLGSWDLEGLLADCSTSVAFDLEPVAVLALFVLDDPSLSRLVGSWRTSSGVCISTESSIVSRSWDFFAAFAALYLRFCSLAFSWACQASGSQSLQISQGKSSVHKVRPSFRRHCWQR